MRPGDLVRLVGAGTLVPGPRLEPGRIRGPRLRVLRGDPGVLLWTDSVWGDDWHAVLFPEGVGHCLPEWLEVVT